LVRSFIPSKAIGAPQVLLFIGYCIYCVLCQCYSTVYFIIAWSHAARWN